MTFIPFIFIFLDIIFLFIINIPYCIYYSKGSDPKWNNHSLNGFDIDASKIIKNLWTTDRSIKKLHNLGLWSALGTLGTFYVGYNVWFSDTYPDMEKPFDRHNRLYFKPFMKRSFGIPSDNDLDSHGYDKQTLEKKKQKD
jgi:hypothetical protein